MEFWPHVALLETTTLKFTNAVDLAFARDLLTVAKLAAIERFADDAIAKC